MSAGSVFPRRGQASHSSTLRHLFFPCYPRFLSLIRPCYVLLHSLLLRLVTRSTFAQSAVMTRITSPEPASARRFSLFSPDSREWDRLSGDGSGEREAPDTGSRP